MADEKSYTLRRLGYSKLRANKNGETYDILVQINDTEIPKMSLDHFPHSSLIRGELHASYASNLYKNSDGTPLTYEQIEKMTVLSSIQVIRME